MLQSPRENILHNLLSIYSDFFDIIIFYIYKLFFIDNLRQLIWSTQLFHLTAMYKTDKQQEQIAQHTEL